VRLVAQAHGSVFDTITTNTFRNAHVIRPSEGVLRRFEASVTPLIERIRILHHEARSLASLRDKLLPRLLSGELSVADIEGLA
jgi:type I restriction enzyme S subunit